MTDELKLAIEAERRAGDRYWNLYDGYLLCKKTGLKEECDVLREALWDAAARRFEAKMHTNLARKRSREVMAERIYPTLSDRDKVWMYPERARRDGIETY